MEQLLQRERLITLVSQRHRLGVVALEAPAGFGRSVLLDQALAHGPVRTSDRDLVHRCGPDDDRPGHLARSLLILCGVGPVHHRAEWADARSAARTVAEALNDAADGGQVALVVDDVQRTGPAGDAFWPALVDRLGDRSHVVLSGRHLPRIGLARMVAAGTGLLIDAGQLAFRPDEVAALAATYPELGRTDAELAAWPAMASLVARGRAEMSSQYLLESILDEAEMVVAKTMAALAVVGGCSDQLLDAVVDTVGRVEGSGTEGVDIKRQVISQLVRLPLVQTNGGCWPHPVWIDATGSYLSPVERNRAVVAKTRGLVRVGAVHDAGRLALRTGNGEALALAVRAALSSQPPLVSVADLRTWADSGLLPTGTATQVWLAAAVDLQLGDATADGWHRLERARHAFELAGDQEAETSVLLHLGHLARSRDDAAALGQVLVRGDALAAGGNRVAQGLVALGHAVAAQMAGDPEAALLALDRVPAGSLTGEWAAQQLMIRGTNLLLAGREEAAVVILEAATGEGSDGSRALAHDLLATARWYAGDPVEAIRDAEIAETLAVRAGSLSLVQRIRATRACFLAASGQREAAQDLLDLVHRTGSISESGEAAGLARMAEALLLADQIDLEGARSLIEATDTVGRAVRSSVWRAALSAALGAGPEEPPLPSGRPHPNLSRAAAAGRAAAEHLAGGPAVDKYHRPYLPTRWCAQDRPSVTLTLQGVGTVERNFRRVTHPAWSRGRVRELCLHLALVEDRNRAGVAAALWPDREDRSAGQNLRVTLTHLLDVIDPDRMPARGSAFIIEDAGRLHFSRAPGLHVDLWDLERHASAILVTPGHERPSLLAQGRRLLAVKSGPPLGGVAVGEWFETHRRRLEELVAAAALHAGSAAVAAGDHVLGEALAQRALQADPWSERAHRLLVEARLSSGNLDGARRGLLHALEVLDDLGVAPGPAIFELARRAGLSPPYNRPVGAGHVRS